MRSGRGEEKGTGAGGRMSEAGKQILIDSENNICPICKQDIQDCAVIEYQEFYGSSVATCKEHNHI